MKKSPVKDMAFVKHEAENDEKVLLELAKRGAKRMFNKTLDELKEMSWYKHCPVDLISLASVGCHDLAEAEPERFLNDRAEFEDMFLHDTYYFVPKDQRSGTNTKSMHLLDLAVKGPPVAPSSNFF